MDEISQVKGVAKSAIRPSKRLGGRRWVLLYACVTVVLTVLVSWLVGALATKHGEPFDWSVCAETATAVATIALAGGTFVLAATALEDAGAARELARVTREDMRLRDRPTIMVTTYEFAFAEEQVRFTVQNIGLGPAVYITVNVTGLDSTADPVLTTGSAAITRTILPNNSFLIELPFAVRGNIEDLATMELFIVSIDRRGATSYALWRVARDGYISMAASDFWTNWKPDESLLERLVGSTPVTVSTPSPDQAG